MLIFIEDNEYIARSGCLQVGSCYKVRKREIQKISTEPKIMNKILDFKREPVMFLIKTKGRIIFFTSTAFKVSHKMIHRWGWVLRCFR